MVLDPNQIQVDRPISLLEEQAAERVYEEEKEKVTFGQAVDAAFAEENTFQKTARITLQMRLVYLTCRNYMTVPKSLLKIKTLLPSMDGAVLVYRWRRQH